RGRRFVGKSTKCTLADHGIEAGVRKPEPFRITLLETHQIRDSFRSLRCFLYVFRSEIDPHDLAAETPRQKNCALAISAGHVENACSGIQREAIAQTFRHTKT